MNQEAKNCIIKGELLFGEGIKN